MVIDVAPLTRLEREQQQEGHHQAEQTHGLGQGESQDGVGEQLLLQRWVASVTDDQRAEHRSDTGTCVWFFCVVCSAAATRMLNVGQTNERMAGEKNANRD